MNTKRLVQILLGIVLIAFGLGIFSLRYNDKDKFNNYNSGGIINVRSDDGTVSIGPNGIEVEDGDDQVSISWDGINIRDGNEHISIGWNGIRVMEGDKTKFNFGNRGTGFNFRSPKLLKTLINQEEFASINDINNISISSSFVSIKVKPEDRDDIRIHYHGNLAANVLPKLIVERNLDTLDIKLETPNNSQVTIYSDLVLEVFVPRSFKGNFSSSTSSGKIDMENLIGESFNIASSSGKVDLEDLIANNINVATSSGKVELEDSIGKINISTSSGAVELDNKNNSEDVKISTSSGSVEITLHKDANYTIKGFSSSGRYSSNIDMNITSNEKGYFSAIIGPGDNTIDINTSSGSVKFKKD